MKAERHKTAEQTAPAHHKTGGKIIRYAPENPGLIFKLILLLLPLLWLLQLLIGASNQGPQLALAFGNNFGLVVLAGATLTTSIVLFLRYRQKFRQLTILDINTKGISIGRLSDRAADAVTFLVSWKEISSVIERPSKFGANHTEKESGWLDINSKLDISFQLTLDNAFRWQTRDNLIDGLIKYAPQAELKLADHSAGHVSPQTSYTTLWLENLESSGKRQRRTPLEPGNKLQEGRFEILGQLGQGGQGRAYLAVTDDNSLLNQSSTSRDGKVVLKEYILPVQADQPASLNLATRASSEAPAKLDGKNAFIGEAAILAKLNHPNIMQLFDCFQEDFRGYLVLEYVRGQSIRDRLNKDGTYSELEALPIALSLSDALSYLHSLNPPVIHGDISPENAMISRHGEAKFIDFTVAHEFKNERSTMLFGKPGYLAPEQYYGYNLPASEVYALGATIYFMVSGLDPQPMLEPTLHKSGVAVSDEFNNIIATAMRPEVKERYRSGTELYEALLALASPN